MSTRLMNGRTNCYRLPRPISTNSLFLNFKGRVCTKEYLAWKKEAGLMLMAQRARAIVGPVEIYITVEERPQLSDIDNRIKCCLDLLVSHGIISSDDQRTVRGVTARWGGVVGCEVEIVPVSIKSAKAAA